MEIILGFDVSSTTTAYTVYTVENKSILKIEYGHFKPQKKGTIFEKLNALEKQVLSILQKHNPTKVVIEDIAKFMPGKSTANTIITLALYNRTVGLTCFKENLEPVLYNVLQIRHAIKTTKNLPKKEDIPKELETRLNIKFPFLYDKKGKIKKESYDISDAYAVGLAYLLKNKLI